MDWLRNRRRREPEWMDEVEADPQELRRSLRFIRRINERLGYTRGVVEHLERFSRRWRPGEQITILDLATGSADIPRAILDWAQHRGFDVRIVGIDRHPATAEAAADDLERQGTRRDVRADRNVRSWQTGMSAPPENVRSWLQIVQADVFEPPFADGSFDYVMTAMFLHHLDEPQIVRVLRTMDRLARRGVIVADLLRHRRAYLWIKLFTLLAGPMVRHDAAVSVAQALTEEEVLSLRRQVGLDYAQYHRQFAHRFVLAGEKAGG